jgi:hypothetical protein
LALLRQNGNFFECGCSAAARDAGNIWFKSMGWVGTRASGVLCGWYWIAGRAIWGDRSYPLALPYSFARLFIAMTPEERERMNWLVLRIQQEKDHDKFTELVDELNKLIEQKEERFPRDPK